MKQIVVRTCVQGRRKEFRIGTAKLSRMDVDAKRRRRAFGARIKRESGGFSPENFVKATFKMVHSKLFWRINR